jgi:hypothetical protein
MQICNDMKRWFFIGHSTACYAKLRVPRRQLSAAAARRAPTRFGAVLSLSGENGDLRRAPLLLGNVTRNF